MYNNFLPSIFQTDDQNTDKEQELQNHVALETHNSTPDVESCHSECPLDEAPAEEMTQNNELDMLKQRQFIERLQRFSSLKRKSEEFLQKTYYGPEIFNFEKKTKKDKQYNKLNNTNMQPSSKYDQYHQIFHENPADSVNLSTHKSDNPNKSNEVIEKCKLDQTSPAILNTDLKTECEDNDIIITDPAVCEATKSFETSREVQKDGLEFQSQQDSKFAYIHTFVHLFFFT